jgi:hypothetical protein
MMKEFAVSKTGKYVLVRLARRSASAHHLTGMDSIPSLDL